MNKLSKSLVLLCACAMLIVNLVGCGTPQTTAADDGKLPVVASFYPVAFLTEQIGGDKVSVKTMVPTGSEPHVWEPTPNDLVDVGKSKLFVYLGLGMDAWAPNVLSSLGKDAPASVEASHDVEPLTYEQEHADHDHDHDHDGHDADHDHDHDADHDHDHDADHDHDHDADHHDHDHEHGHSHSGVDPHIWLDPIRSKALAKNILDALVEVDPSNKDYYENNYNELAKKLDEVNAAYESGLSGIKDKKIVVSHEAYGYICSRYGIEQVGISGLSPDTEPDAKTMAEIVDLVKNDHIKVVFYEELVSPKVAKQIASETGASAESLSPIEGLSAEDIQAGQNYFTKMYENLEKLKAAFKND